MYSEVVKKKVSTYMFTLFKKNTFRKNKAKVKEAN